MNQTASKNEVRNLATGSNGSTLLKKSTLNGHSSTSAQGRRLCLLRYCSGTYTSVCH